MMLEAVALMLANRKLAIVDHIVVSVHTLVVDHNLVAIHMQVAAAAISKVGPSVHTVVLHFDLEP